MNPHQITPRISFTQLLRYEYPKATAWVRGNYQNPQLSGLVKFYQTPYDGVLVEAEFFGLPKSSEENSGNFFAMHIHEFGDCSDNFTRTGDHFNPTAKPHPFHAGDLLPLLGNQGYAWTAFYDKRFTIDDIIGKSVVIHEGRDDFSSQPSGNAGNKIACGEIRQGL